jgi:hypothetical protein
LVSATPFSPLRKGKIETMVAQLRLSEDKGFNLWWLPLL